MAIKFCRLVAAAMSVEKILLSVLLKQSVDDVLLLDCDCYMLGKWWTGAYCKYFRNAVLPTDPALEATLTGGAAVETRPCALCGGEFTASGRKAYCSDACAVKAQRRQQREHMRKKRDES